MHRLGYLFYLVNPRATYFESAEQVPAYITEAIPFFVGLIVLEQLIALWKGLQLLQLNDAITSAAQGILMEQSKVIIPSFSVAYYICVYDNWRLCTLPTDSLVVWVACLLLVDLGYYWFHRACHEVNFLWATHQAHHSSEYFNLSTALRQSLIQLYFHSLFYVPLALFMPPSVFLVHFEFNTLFQFWIHTELIDHLGPLGYLLNTPSHHRVHHGRNRYCIDKNYGSVLIIWDRIFGTFEPEREKVIYGLTHPVETFDTFYLQTFHYVHLWNRLRQFGTSSLANSLSVLFKGPGWDVGTPRLGRAEDIPDITEHSGTKPYQPVVAMRYQYYCVAHFALVVLFHVYIVERSAGFSQALAFLLFSFVFLSLTSFGALMDGKSYAASLELARCLLFFAIDMIVLPGFGAANLLASVIIRSAFFVSLCIWTFSFAQEIARAADQRKLK